MGSAVLFILRSRLLLYSAGSEMNRVQVVLSGFSVRLLCFVKLFSVCMVVCISRVLCFVPVLRGCVWYVCCYASKKALLQCRQLLKGGIYA